MTAFPFMAKDGKKKPDAEMIFGLIVFGRLRQ
jgi:hypothetical protein